MTDEIELECISEDEEDVCAVPPAPDNARSSASNTQEAAEQHTVTTDQETRRDSQAQGTTPQPANAATESDSSNLHSPPPARAELEPAGSPPRDRVQGHSTTHSSSMATRNHQSSVQLHAVTQEVQGRPQRNGSRSTQRQESVLTDDPPPPYPGLSSTSYVQQTPLHIQQRHSHPHHSPMQASRTGHSHIAVLHHNTMPTHGHQHQHCSLLHGNSNFHHSVTCAQCAHAHGYHHPEMFLPGEIQPYAQYDPMPRQPPHSTVLLPHTHGPDLQQNSANDYLMLSFVCVVLCALHLNLPALICVLPALAYSIKARQLNSEGMVRRGSRYSRAALLCNLLAFCQYIIFLIAAATVSVLYWE